MWDFAETFTPREPIFATYIQRKSELVPEQVPLMSKETKKSFGEALATLIENEVKAEIYR
jgi:hypothetical protein